jgi:hypothetical protein
MAAAVSVLGGSGIHARGGGNNRAHRQGYIHYKPTAKDKDQVRRLVLLGSPRENIAQAMGLSVPILEKHFLDILQYYEACRLSEVAGKAYSLALKGNVPMVQFILRTRGRWKENILGDEDVQLIKRVIGVDDKDV